MCEAVTANWHDSPLRRIDDGGGRALRNAARSVARCRVVRREGVLPRDRQRQATRSAFQGRRAGGPQRPALRPMVFFARGAAGVPMRFASNPTVTAYECEQL